MALKNTPVRWAELRPDQFRERQTACPIVYLPIGLCEPHGHVAALGLDLIKAEFLCENAAARFGGIVAPSQGYHIHESGFHARWLEEVVGEVNPFLAALPPYVMAYLFLYQLRAFVNAGFQAVVAISGHGGGSELDLRRITAAFTAKTGVPVVMKNCSEFVTGQFQGDHAGRHEVSQLMAIRPDLVDLTLFSRQYETNSGGRLAAGPNAPEATVEYGREVNEAILASIGRTIAELRQTIASSPPGALLTYQDMEEIWSSLPTAGPSWTSGAPKPGQKAVSPGSRWQSAERLP